MRLHGLLCCLLIAASAEAQSPAGASVHGVVFDSVVLAPLAGAVVQAAYIDSTRGPAAIRTFSVVADAKGRYVLKGLPRGRFAIGFLHDALSALGLESPLRAFEITSDTDVLVNLAIPPGVRVRASRCPRVGDASDGMLAGFVFDAARDLKLNDAEVYITWLEIALVDGKPRAVPRRIAAKGGASGRYIACGLASGTPLGLEVMRAGYRQIVGEITIPTGSVLRRDFRLADTSSTVGRGAVRGRVRHADGTAVSSGRAAIPALGLDVPVVNGAFTMTAVPSGTWVIEARVAGYEPQAVLTDVADGAPAAVPITIGAKVRSLDAVSVVSKPAGVIEMLTDVAERGRKSFGTVFLPGNSWLKSALHPVDVLAAARGFTYLSLDAARARGCSSVGSDRKRLVVYLDGGRFAGGLEELRSMVPMRDVLAIEAYPDVIAMPAKWRTSDACAVVAVWTKH